MKAVNESNKLSGNVLSYKKPRDDKEKRNEEIIVRSGTIVAGRKINDTFISSSSVIK